MTNKMNLLEIYNSLSPMAKQYIADFLSAPMLVSERHIVRVFTGLYSIVDEEGFDERAEAAMRSNVVSDAEYWSEDPEWRPYDVHDGTLIVPIQGVLENKFDFATGKYTGYSYLSRVFERGMNDDSVERIVSRIDSPGGTAAGNFELAEQIASYRGQKEMVASVDTLACSGAFSLAAAHDSINVDSSGYTGSVGVISQHVSFSEWLKDAGIEFKFIYAGDRKKDGNMVEPLAPEAESRMQERVDKFYEKFTGSVAANLDIPLEDVIATQADIFDADESLEKKFATNIMSFNETISAFTAEDNREGSFMSKTNNTANTNTESQTEENATQVDKAAVVSQTTDDLNARMRTVMGDDAYKGREAVANKLLTESTMSADAIISTIKEIPIAEQVESKPQESETKETETRSESHFESHMKKEGSPNMESDDSGSTGNIADMSPADQSKAILADFQAAGGEVAKVRDELLQ